MNIFTWRVLSAIAGAFLLGAAAYGGMLVWAHESPVVFGCNVQLKEIDFESPAAPAHGYCRDLGASIQHLFR